MTPATARIGLLAYGPGDARHREAAVALLTTRAFAPAGTELVVFTDRPHAYRWFGDFVTVEALQAPTIAEWQGPRRDRYRPKIEVLRRLAGDGAADVMLIDTDVMARRDLTPLLERLAHGSTILHCREYLLAAPPRRGDRSLKHDMLGRSWCGITPDPASAAMWNGGVVGGARIHRGMFDQVLAVFDELREASGHFAVEQLAYSIVFPAYGTVEAAAPWFDHYWANRDHFDREIERFLADAALESITPQQAVDRLRLHPIVGALDGRRPRWRRRLRQLLDRLDRKSVMTERMERYEKEPSA